MASLSPASEVALRRCRAALDAMYGDAHPEPDYDVAVFLKSLPDIRSPRLEMDRLAILRAAMLDETGAFFDVLPYDATAYRERSPRMREIRTDGFSV